jgi:methylmalonyl-CoA mutase
MSETHKKLFSEFSPIDQAQWDAEIRADLKGDDYDKALVWKTMEGFSVQPYYMTSEGAAEGAASDFSSPILRAKPTGDWHIREEIFETDFTKANAAAKDALMRGATSVAFFAEPKTARDMTRLLDGIWLEVAPVHFYTCSSAPDMLALLTGEAIAQKINLPKLHGSLDYDCLAAFASTGVWENSGFETAAKLMHGVQALPNMKVLTIRADVYHNAGATAVQELAFALNAASDYLAALTEQGVSADTVCNHLEFSFAVGTNYFMELAKIRAVRLLWETIARTYNASEQAAAQTTIHVSSSAANKTLYDAHNNLLRGTVEAMAASLGGANSITVLPFDTVYDSSKEFSAHLARNTSLILKDESHFDKLLDAARGSYYIESLTSKLADAAWTLFKTIETSGGMLAALKSGKIQTDLNASRAARVERLEQRRDVLVGVSQFANPKEHASEKVSSGKVSSQKTPAQKSSAGAAEPVPLAPSRGAEAFEAIRLKTEAMPVVPTVLLATFGDVKLRNARAAFAQNFLSVAGFDIIESSPLKSTDEVAAAVKKHQPHVVALCSSDDDYAALTMDFLASLKPSVIVVAGFPKEAVERLTGEGVAAFIHIKSNAVQTLQTIQKKVMMKS